MSLDEVKLFKSDFKLVAEFLVQKRLKMEYTPSPDKLKHVDGILKMMTAITGNKAYVNQLKSKRRRPRNMCEVTEGLINKGRLEMLSKVKAAENRAELEKNKAEQAQAKLDKLMQYFSRKGINLDEVLED